MTSTPTKYATCTFCDREMNGQECGVKTYTIGGTEYARLAYPPTDLDWMKPDEFPERCHDCGVAKGGLHHMLCDMEDCPAGDGQRLSCDHGPHAPK